MKTIFTGFSPNTGARDVTLALSYLLLPWKWFSWRQGNKALQSEEALEAYFGNGTSAITFDSGRSALFAALTAMNIGTGDEVLVQAFTCVVVINAIRWAGATPVYVDIDPDTLNMNPQDAQKKCTERTRAIIIQHTFGRPADIEALLTTAKEKQMLSIEDCAHSLGASYKGKLTGTYADIGMFSFGGEKIISSVRGGALITKDTEIARTLRRYQEQLPQLSRKQVFQHLMHLVLFPFGKRIYSFGGKALLHIAKQLNITNKIIESPEKRGERLSYLPAKFPNALAELLLHQIPHIDAQNAHRKHIAALYREALNTRRAEMQAHSTDHVYLRFVYFTSLRDSILRKAKKQHIILGNWYTQVVGPGDVDMAATAYIPGSCPVAEQRTSEVINLPTHMHMTEKDARRVLNVLTE